MCGHIVNECATGSDRRQAGGTVNGFTEHRVFGAPLCSNRSAECVPRGNADRQMQSQLIDSGLQFQRSKARTPGIVLMSLPRQSKHGQSLQAPLAYCHPQEIAVKPGNLSLNGIDGLYISGRTIVATQNGVSPERVVRFELDPSMTRIESESVIERATPGLGEPTHGVFRERDFYYIANSGWDALNNDGTPKPGMVPGKAALMRYSFQAIR